MRVVCGIRLAFQAERCRFEPCSPLHLIESIDMFSWFRSKTFDNWRLVKTITVPNITFGHEKIIVYFHLFESSKKKRKVEVAVSTDMSDADKRVKVLAHYQEIVYPWLQGRVNPDIPRYDEIPEEETAVMLRGKI